jgi:prealbumin domain-containing protein
MRLLCAAMTVIGALGLSIGGARELFRSSPAYADGAVACASNTTPADPGQGFCANYNGDVTWYGTYGSAAAPLPTTGGFGLCADPAASGGDFPEPSYDYAPSGPPSGAAGADMPALGFALSEGYAFGWWKGVSGRFTAAQAGVAAKLLYDRVAWGSAIPALDPGVNAALAELQGWFNEAKGTALAAPLLSVGLSSGGSSFTGSATVQAHLQFAGSDGPVVGQSLTFTATNGSFNSASGPSSVLVSTDGNGNAAVAFFASGAGPVSVTVATPAGAPIGIPGTDFYGPTRGNMRAQTLAGFGTPGALAANGSFSALAPVSPVSPVSPPAAQTGTVSVHKAGNDEAYYGVGGATFQILQGSTVVTTLTTNDSGQTAASAPLPIGPYVVHESHPPSGYAASPDQPITVNANANTVAAFTGSNQELISPSSLTIHKVDAQGGAPLSGATFAVDYSSVGNSTFDQQLGTCTTNGAGVCAPIGNDGDTGFLPGNYQVQELEAPDGYSINPATSTQSISLLPGTPGSVTFSDLLLGSLQIQKSGDDSSYASVDGAAFTVSGPSPGNGVVGTLTVGADGTSNVITGMVPGSYNVTESAPPPSYQPIAPMSVAVTSGDAVTTLDVLDHVIPATLTIFKLDRESMSPLGGASFRVSYDVFNSGDYSEAIGSCTTTSNGLCDPPGNDGPNQMLPGNYQITEVVAPDGYDINPANATQDVTLTAGEVSIVRFTDSLLVRASFLKVATGNVNATQVSLAGVTVDVHQGTPTGATVASCITGASGACTTPAALDAGSTYCWAEVTAPIGLSGGAHDCFTATDSQASDPITIVDAGLFVAVAVQKVDAANPAVSLPGAVFDLYRKDGGKGPGTLPNAPGDAAHESGETWVGRSTTGTDGTATFALQYPGFAYCAVEQAAPSGYAPATGQKCTGVLTGATATPAHVTTLQVADTANSTSKPTPQTVTLAAHKFNVLTPNTGIPGATYDLYVEGSSAGSGTISSPPGNALKEPGDTWFARGTTDQSGNLSFTVPPGYAWCMVEEAAPVDYIPDTGLHCSQTLTTSSAAAPTTVALPETRSTIYIAARKYNSLQPDTVIPGATYELLVQGPLPSGYVAPSGPPPPTGADIPPTGDTYWGQGTTNAQGILTFAVPAGYSWCLHELAAPSGYQPDPSYHCTSVLTNQTPASAAAIALPEFPGPNGHLAFTGGPPLWMPVSGVLLILGGAGLLVLRRRLHAHGQAEAQE